MDRTTQNKITLCMSCRHKGTDCRPGYELIARLREAIDVAGDAVPEAFEVSGLARMAGCDRSCTVAFHSTREATYLFGDVAPEEDIEDLMVFAQQYAALEDGWGTTGDHAASLRTPTLARVPAAMIALEKTTERMA